MADVSTMDTDAAVAQALRMAEAGAEYIRFTAQGEREAHNLGLIRSKLREKRCETPLVADIHFNPKAAEVATFSRPVGDRGNKAPFSAVLHFVCRG